MTNYLVPSNIFPHKCIVIIVPRTFVQYWSRTVTYADPSCRSDLQIRACRLERGMVHKTAVREHRDRSDCSAYVGKPKHFLHLMTSMLIESMIVKFICIVRVVRLCSRVRPRTLKDRPAGS